MIYTKTMELAGSSYEIGKRLGNLTATIPPLMASQASGFQGLDKEQVQKAITCFDRWCPGLSEELEGFADALSIDPVKVTFYAMTYLVPRCSQMLVSPQKSTNGHTLLARNYEFNHNFDDFALVRTGIEGKYTHLGTGVTLFGRDEGINECGLAVTMSSCGLPVGALEKMRRPALAGLQYWAAIRALLENCKDVEEALAYLKDMPIAFNVNLTVADKAGNAALIETMDGRMAVQKLGEAGYLAATNHVVIPELKAYEPFVMGHSAKRLEVVEQMMDDKDKISMDDLKELQLRHYPEGLCSHYYEDFFGTTKSIVMDVTSGTLDICWAGLEKNGWQSYKVSEPLAEGLMPKDIEMKRAPKDFFG